MKDRFVDDASEHDLAGDGVTNDQPVAATSFDTEPAGGDWHHNNGVADLG